MADTVAHVRPVRPPELVVANVPTPFAGLRGADVDHRALDELLGELEGRVDAVLVASSTGQFLALHDDERLSLFDQALAAFGPDRVVAHVGAATLHHVLRLAEAAGSLGVVRFALVTPYYLPVDDAAVLDWFGTVAAALPGIELYPSLFPERTGVTVAPGVVAEIARLPGVAGIGVSGAASARVAEYAAALQPGQRLWSGEDACLPSVLAAGGQGVTSGTATAVPGLFDQLRSAARRGADLEELQQLVRPVAAAVGTTVPRLHLALRLRTGHPWRCRMAGASVDAATEQQIGRLLDQVADARRRR